MVRANFNGFGNALISIFILLTAENWNSVLGAYIAQFGYVSSLYFVSLIIFGNIMLLNLFLAILLNSVSGGPDDDEAEETESGDKSVKSDKEDKKDEKEFSITEKKLDQFEKEND